MKNRIMIATINDLDPAKTFECGQCFRWFKCEDYLYCGIVDKKLITMIVEKTKIFIEFDGYFDWNSYFDLHRDYRSMDRSLSGYSEYLDTCIRHGKGIRILQQDPWETLISFIISQCNNIPRIQGIIDRLCSLAGTPIDDSHYTFPQPDQILSLNQSQWETIKAGYRTKYILAAAKMMINGYDFEPLKYMHWKASRECLKSFDGVGNKVADCVNLFGLGHIESFPVDTWIRKALNDHFTDAFNPESLGEYAGLAQQYIFAYERSTHT